MQSFGSLDSLHIPWKGTIRQWNTIPRSLFPSCNAKGEVFDCSGHFLFQLEAKQQLGSGTFGIIDAFQRKGEDGSKLVAMKRNSHPSIDLCLEALFQWKLHQALTDYGIQSSIPKVYDIFTYKPTGDIWFTMEAFAPNLLSKWCATHLASTPSLFPLFMLQIALVLEVLENALHIDHRDLKVNNLLVVDEPITMDVTWKGKPRTLQFPFRIVIVDFGFACIQRLLDLREGDGLPPLDPCPKVGRDMFQVLVSLWSIGTIRGCLEAVWGAWVREKLQNAGASVEVNCLQLAESSSCLDWMYTTTDCASFSAPLCAPYRIIEECLGAIERG